MEFPRDTQEELDAFYSKHKLGSDGLPTAAWKKEHLTTITPAYPLTLAFPPGTQVTKVTCHKKVADSLKRIFEQIRRARVGPELPECRHDRLDRDGCGVNEGDAG